MLELKAKVECAIQDYLQFLTSISLCKKNLETVLCKKGGTKKFYGVYVQP